MVGDIALFKTWLSKSWNFLGQIVSTWDPCQELCLSWLGVPRHEHIWLSRLRDMELQKNVTVQNLGIQALIKKIFHNCGCQIFKRIVKCVHVLEDQVMKDIILGKGLMFQFFTPKSLKTWKAKSWIVQSLSRLGDMELQKNVTVQNLGYQVLKEKCKISELWLPSLDNHVHLCSCLGRPSHERHKSLLYCWKSILHEVSRLGKPSLE